MKQSFRRSIFLNTIFLFLSVVFSSLLLSPSPAHAENIISLNGQSLQNQGYEGEGGDPQIFVKMRKNLLDGLYAYEYVAKHPNPVVQVPYTLLNIVGTHDNPTGFLLGYGDPKAVSYQDILISAISKDGKLTVSGDPRGNIDVPMTNCVLVGGTGEDDTIKIVFRRVGEDSETDDMNSFINEVNHYIYDGYAQIDPFKTYLNRISFYVDLKKISHADLIARKSGTILKDDLSLVQSSSCNGIGGKIFYVTFFNDQNFHYAWSPVKSGQNGRVYINDSPMVTINGSLQKNFYNQGYSSILSLLHEEGHALGLLKDEYYTPGSIGDTDQLFTTSKNCSTDPLNDFRYSGSNKMYGGIIFASIKVGCQYNFDSKASSIIYRPNANSLMNNQLASPKKFNIISCGYLVAALLGEPIDKAHAEKHWPAIDQSDNPLVPLTPNSHNGLMGCAAMDIAKDGLPPVANPPKVNGISSGGVTGLAPSLGAQYASVTTATENAPIESWVQSVEKSLSSLFK